MAKMFRNLTFSKKKVEASFIHDFSCDLNRILRLLPVLTGYIGFHPNLLCRVILCTKCFHIRDLNTRHATGFDLYSYCSLFRFYFHRMYEGNVYGINVKGY